MEDPFQDPPAQHPSEDSGSGSDSLTTDLVRTYLETGSSSSLLGNTRNKKGLAGNPHPPPPRRQYRHANGLDGQQSSPSPGGQSNIPHLKRQLSPPAYNGTTLGSGISPEKDGMRLPKSRVSSESAKPSLRHATLHDGIRHASSPRPNLGIREFPLAPYPVPLLPFTEADIPTGSQPCEPMVELKDFLRLQRSTKDGDRLRGTRSTNSLEQEVQELQSEICRRKGTLTTAQKDLVKPEADHKASSPKEVGDWHPEGRQTETPSSSSAAQKHGAQDEGIRVRDFAPTLRAGNEANYRESSDGRKDILYRAGHRIKKRIFGTKPAKEDGIAYFGKKGSKQNNTPVKKAGGKKDGGKKAEGTKDRARASMDGTAGGSASTEFITIAKVAQPRRESGTLECTAYEETHAQLGSPHPKKHHGKRARLWRRMSALF